jgi:hypothetical protein
MRKFTANYLISDSGDFLKNGIVVSEDDGTVLQYIDTSGDLKEIAGLSFHNGILIGGLNFSRPNESIRTSYPKHPVFEVFIKLFWGLSSISIRDFVEFGKQIQKKFPEMKIPEIMKELSDILLLNAGFRKEKVPGIYLLTGTDLPQLRFKPITKLKRIC